MRLAVWGSCFVSTEMFCRLLKRKCGLRRARSASSCAWFRLDSSCDFSRASLVARCSCWCNWNNVRTKYPPPTLTQNMPCALGKVANQ